MNDKVKKSTGAAPKPKVVLTKAQQNAIFKAKPSERRDFTKSNSPIINEGAKKAPTWTKLAKQYGVSVFQVQKAWGEANLRQKGRQEKAVTTYRNKDKHARNPSGKMTPISRLVSGKPKVPTGVKQAAQVKDVTARANQKATQAIRILKQSERTRRGRGGGGAGLSLDDLSSKPGPKRPYS